MLDEKNMVFFFKKFGLMGVIDYWINNYKVEFYMLWERVYRLFWKYEVGVFKLVRGGVWRELEVFVRIDV